MQLNYTLEDFPLNGEELTLELEVEFSVSKYTPASMYGGPDHVGWPEEGGEVEIESIRVVDATMDDDTPRKPALAMLQAAFDAAEEKYSSDIIDRCYEAAAEYSE